MQDRVIKLGNSVVLVIIQICDQFHEARANITTNMAKVKSFWLYFRKLGQSSKVMVTGNKCWYKLKGIVLRNIHVKFEGLIVCDIEMSDKNVFLKYGKKRGDKSVKFQDRVMKL